MSQLLSIALTQPQKKFVTDLLKTKAGTTYVNNELAKKASQSNVNTALAALKEKVKELEATVSELQGEMLLLRSSDLRTGLTLQNLFQSSRFLGKI